MHAFFTLSVLQDHKAPSLHSLALREKKREPITQQHKHDCAPQSFMQALVFTQMYTNKQTRVYKMQTHNPNVWGVNKKAGSGDRVARIIFKNRFERAHRHSVPLSDAAASVSQYMFKDHPLTFHSHGPLCDLLLSATGFEEPN